MLGHSMTQQQRWDLEQFFQEESGHGEMLAEAFGCVGLSANDLRSAQGSPETKLYQRFFYASGHQSVADFAVALVIPEVKEAPLHSLSAADSGELVVTDVMETRNGVPAALVEAFRKHEEEDVEMDHGNLVVSVLREEGMIARERAEVLFATLELGMSTFDLFLRGVVRRYADWDGKLDAGVFGEY